MELFLPVGYHIGRLANQLAIYYSHVGVFFLSLSYIVLYARQTKNNFILDILVEIGGL